MRRHWTLGARVGDRRTPLLIPSRRTSFPRTCLTVVRVLRIGSRSPQPPPKVSGSADRSLVLVLGAAAFSGIPIARGQWHVTTSLPLALCDVALVVAPIALLAPWLAAGRRVDLLLGAGGHASGRGDPGPVGGVPRARVLRVRRGSSRDRDRALFLVVGLRQEPRPGAVWRAFAITLGYTAAVGLFDWVTGSNCMYPKAVPRHPSVHRRLPRRGQRGARHGQPQHPFDRLPLPGIPAREGLRPGQPIGDPPHPQHGSWLNFAEIEPSCLTKQCLGRRVAEIDVLNAELDAWTRTTNADERQVDWRFTASDARIKYGTYTQRLRGDARTSHRQALTALGDQRRTRERFAVATGQLWRTRPAARPQLGRPGGPRGLSPLRPVTASAKCRPRSLPNGSTGNRGRSPYIFTPPETRTHPRQGSQPGSKIDSALRVDSGQSLPCSVSAICLPWSGVTYVSPPTLTYAVPNSAP